MIQTMFRAAGRIALWLATMAFLCAASLFVIGSYLLTWPLLRLSPRERRVRAIVDFASSAMAVATAFGEANARKALVNALELAEREEILLPEDEDEDSGSTSG